ncbi:MAG TPA: hypothetical protein PKD50_00395, partial [Leptospiraceae bacterium]|nr:hypothetical protein [Leptospiraceae bacterium]
DDIRMTEAATNLTVCGYTVVVPEFEEIKALKISQESPRNIKDAFLIILDQKDLNTESIGFFSISFSAGFGLIAFTDPEISTKVKSIIAIGGFAEILDTCNFAMLNYEKDDYPTNILFYNYIHLLYDNCEELAKAFYEAALDNGLSRRGKDQVAPRIYENLSKGHREIFDRVKTSATFRKELGLKISQAYEKEAKSISPIYFIEKIKAPVCLLHGKNDDVISENESIKLSKQMNAYNIDHVLELTGLLSHGDKIPFWKQLSSLPGLSHAFGYFFENLREKK